MTVRGLTGLAEREARLGAELGALIAAARKELELLHERRAELDHEIAQRARKVRAWETARSSLGAGETRHLRAVSQSEPTKREAVLAFLAEHPHSEFKLRELRQALIARGWMRDDRSSIHALEVAAIGMASRGEIGRPRKGVYTLQPQSNREGSHLGMLDHVRRPGEREKMSQASRRRDSG